MKKAIAAEPRKHTHGKERNHFKYFSKYGEMLEPTEVEIKKAKAPSDWSLIYDSMAPIEKGTWNAQQRKKGMNGKTAEPLNQPKLEKPKKKIKVSYKSEPIKLDWDLGTVTSLDFQNKSIVKPKLPQKNKEIYGLGYLLSVDRNYD